MAALGRSGTAGSPYCWTRSVFVRPLLRIVQYPVSASRLTVTGSDAIPSAGRRLQVPPGRGVLPAVAGDGDVQDRIGVHGLHRLPVVRPRRPALSVLVDVVEPGPQYGRVRGHPARLALPMARADADQYPPRYLSTEARDLSGSRLSSSCLRLAGETPRRMSATRAGRSLLEHLRGASVVHRQHERRGANRGHLGERAHHGRGVRPGPRCARSPPMAAGPAQPPGRRSSCGRAGTAPVRAEASAESSAPCSRLAPERPGRRSAAPRRIAMALSRFPPSASSQRLMILAASYLGSASSSSAALSVGMPATTCAWVSTGRPDSAVGRGPGMAGR